MTVASDVRTAKIVFNACYGGFGLSHAAVMRYAELKGLALYPEETRFSSLTGPTYWTVPPEQRPASLEGRAWHAATLEQRQESNRLHRDAVLDVGKIPRADSALVQVVEELGEAASGRFAKLQIAEVPKGERYRIDEYDGFESVETVSSYEWGVA